MKLTCAPLSEPQSHWLLPNATCSQHLTSFHPLCRPCATAAGCPCSWASLPSRWEQPLPPPPTLSPQQWDASPAVSEVSRRAACLPCSPLLPPGCGSLPGPLPGSACPPHVPAAAGRPGQGARLGCTHLGTQTNTALWGRNPGLALTLGGTKCSHSAAECP